MGQRYYELLGVSPEAPTEEIAAAYRDRLKETHPDVSDASDAGERTKQLIEAKEVLTDETERARYDRLGHERYVSAEHGHTPDTDPNPDPEPRETDEPDSESGQPGPTAAGAASARRTDTSSEDSPGSDTGRRTRSRNRRDSRDVDWGTHTARQGRGPRTDGIDWEEWADTDWDAVSEAVWQEVTGEQSTGSRHTTAGWETDRDSTNSPGTATHSSDTPGWSDSNSNHDSARAGSGGATSSAPGASTDTAATSHGATGTAATSATPRGTTADDGDWTVGWYSGGDTSGTTHDSYSFGGTDLTGDSWTTWSPGSEHDSRFRQSSFPPHRILSPVQTVVMFCLCFLTYPLLVTGSVFPLFGSPVRLLLAVLLVFVVAMLIILSQLGIAVFGGWTLLFPVAFANLGIPVFGPSSLLTMSAVFLSLGLAMLSWLLIRPPVV